MAENKSIELPRGVKDHRGRKFGRLTVIAHAGFWTTCVGKQSSLWECRCDCGKSVVVKGPYLTQGDTKSCGCLNIDKLRSRVRTHNMSKTRIYDIWQRMIARCSRKSAAEYKNYGGRGITVDPSWKDFNRFITDMGMPPSDKHTIDRKDNNQGYGPDNCQWSTRAEQARNKRNNLWFTHDGTTLCLKDWSARVGMPNLTLWSRIFKLGWTFKEAITAPRHTKLNSLRYQCRKTLKAQVRR